MNKFITKVAKLTLGLAMAAGVGVAVSAGRKDIHPARASDATLSYSGSGSNVTVTYNSVASKSAVKIGASKSTGTASFSVESGSTSCSFYAAGWNGKAVVLALSITSGSISPTTVSLTANANVSGNGSSYTINGSDDDYKHTFTLTNVTANATITISKDSTSNDNRAAIWNPEYTAGSSAKPLNVPTNLSRNNYVITWTGDSHASSYTIEYDGVETTGISTTSYTIPNYTAGNHTFKVKSVGDETNYSTSAYSTALSWDDRTVTSITINNGDASLALTTASPATALSISTSPSGLTPLSYASSDESVVTVSNGTITVVGAGSSTITVSYAGSSSYASTSSTITVNVTKVTNPLVFDYEDYSTDYSAGDTVSTFTKTDWSVEFNKNTNSNTPKYYGDGIRLYGGGYILITSETKNFSSITLDYSGSLTFSLNSGNSGSYNSSTKTWTKGSTSTNSVRLNESGTSGNNKIKTITVVFETATEATSISFDEDTFEVYATESFSFTPTLTGGDGTYEKTINWVSSNTSVIPHPTSSEDGEEVTVTPGSVQSNTIITITGTVDVSGGASGTVTVTVKPARSVDHYSVSGTPTASVGNSWDLSACVLHGWYDVNETEEKNLVKGTDYSLTTSTPVGNVPGNVQVRLTDSLSKISGYWDVTGTVTHIVEVNVTIDATTENDITTIAAEEKVVYRKGIVTVTVEKNGSTNPWNYIGQGASGSRIYADNIITISANGNVLKTIQFNDAETYSSGQYARALGTSDWENATAESVDGGLLITADTSATEITKTASNKAQFSSIVVIYEAPYVPVTGISLNKTSITMTSYDEDRLVASALPIDASVGGVTFGGYDSDILTVDANGNILPTGTKFGLTTITVTSLGDKQDSTKATATCTVNITRASFKEAKYTYNRTSHGVDASGDISGLTGTYTTSGSAFGVSDHLEGSKSATLTVSGLTNKIVKSVAFKIRTKGEQGSGSLSITAGSTTLKTISTAAFNDETWNGEWASSDIVLIVDMTNDEYVIQNSESLTVTISCSVDGFFITDYRVRYIKSGLPEEAVTFANKILSELTCNAQGTSAPSTSQWEALRIYYLDDENVPTESRTVLFEAVASDHDYDPSIDLTDAQVVAAAMAKYDYVIAKYGRLEDGNGNKIYKDFINRNPAPLSLSNSLIKTIVGENTNTVAIIVIISMVSVTAIGGYFFLRKRKEQ